MTRRDTEVTFWINLAKAKFLAEKKLFMNKHIDLLTRVDFNNSFCRSRLLL